MDYRRPFLKKLFFALTLGLVAAAKNGSAPRWKIAAMTWQDYPNGKLIEMK
jgi:hypothetical protein